MPLLQVRDIPEDLYANLAKVAQMENRSIAQETIVLLKSALEFKEERMARRNKILEEIDNFKLEDVESFPSPSDLIREDRDR